VSRILLHVPVCVLGDLSHTLLRVLLAVFGRCVCESCWGRVGVTHGGAMAVGMALALQPHAVGVTVILLTVKMQPLS
jgi:hypothetical protein